MILRRCNTRRPSPSNTSCALYSDPCARSFTPNTTTAPVAAAASDTASVVGPGTVTASSYRRRCSFPITAAGWMNEKYG